MLVHGSALDCLQMPFLSESLQHTTDSLQTKPEERSKAVIGLASGGRGGGGHWQQQLD